MWYWWQGQQVSLKAPQCSHKAFCCEGEEIPVAPKRERKSYSSVISSMMSKNLWIIFLGSINVEKIIAICGPVVPAVKTTTQVHSWTDFLGKTGVSLNNTGNVTSLHAWVSRQGSLLDYHSTPDKKYLWSGVTPTTTFLRSTNWSHVCMHHTQNIFTANEGRLAMVCAWNRLFAHMHVSFSSHSWYVCNHYWLA